MHYGVSRCIGVGKGGPTTFLVKVLISCECLVRRGKFHNKCSKARVVDFGETKHVSTVGGAVYAMQSAMS